MAVSFRRVLFSSLSLWICISLMGIYFLFHLGRYINFGIDLVGGTYLRLDVQVEKAVEAELASRAQLLINKLKRDQPGTPLPALRLENGTAALVFDYEASARNAEIFLRKALQDSRDLEGVMLQHSGNLLVLSLPAEQVKKIENDAVESDISVLESRLNQFGVSEISVTSHGERSIIIELPNVHKDAREIIQRPALLEIKLVEDAANSEEAMIDKYSGELPEGFVMIPGQEEGGRQTIYLVPNYTNLTGRLLKKVEPGIGGRSGFEPVVKFAFNSEGRDKFYDLTSTAAREQKLVAMILDNVVITAAHAERGVDGDVELSGRFTAETTQRIAKLLKSGAFVAPVTFEEERTIGPSLGAAAIRQGLISCIVGFVLLFIFGLLVYKAAGLLAFIVLFYNLLLILFGLSFLGATLTLPGIAGMILTAGMAIDSSILIYERIREELKRGESLRQAVTTGFNGAMAVILDANITHFLVSLVLYKLGTGPIKGFAVTMIVGIVSTLLTGLVLLRSLFNFLIDVVGIKKISI